MNSGEKIQALREALKAQGVDAFLVPVGDEYLGEYVPAARARLSWLTGFTGSAGLGVVMPSFTALFVDGRYTLQARMEAPGLEHYNSTDTKPHEWLATNLPQGAVLAYDPWLHSVNEIERLEKAVARRQGRLQPLEGNPIDVLWKDQPPMPTARAFAMEEKRAGESTEAKCARMGEKVEKAGARVAVLAACDSVNWLLNVRGRDLDYTPVALSYAFLGADGHVMLYIDPVKVTDELGEHLGDEVSLRTPQQLASDLRELPSPVLLDPALTPAWFAQALAKAGIEVIRGEDPCQAAKAVKNEVEIEGMRESHLIDGVAVVRLLHWLQGEMHTGNEVTECGLADRLLALRAEGEGFLSPSFDTIAGSGPNGAIVHYRAGPKSNRTLARDDILLLDSGGQYAGGTTDITRTLTLGTPTREQRQRFTDVLKGHIALAEALFPSGTAGAQLDVLARQFLWKQGADYDHGTGHGVGHALSVHEGPQRIGKRGGDVALLPGMVLSNEPGYYREGEYGIRIENLVLVAERGTMENGKPRLGFETLTCVPIDKALVDASRLTPVEVEWLNKYHAWVERMLKSRIPAECTAWLRQACAPL